MRHRLVTNDDAPALGALNHQLIEDEGHRHSMTESELEDGIAGLTALVSMIDSGMEYCVRLLTVTGKAGVLSRGPSPGVAEEIVKVPNDYAGRLG